MGASYVMQKDRNMTNQGTYNNPLVGAYVYPRGNGLGRYRNVRALRPVIAPI